MQTQTKKPFYRILYVQVLIAIVIGIVLGHFKPDLAVQMKPLGDAFIKLIKMIIGPVIFCTVVTGIAGMEDMKKVGRVGGKAILYFEIVSTFALVIGLAATHILKPGAGFNVDINTLDPKAISGYAAKAAHGETFVDFLMHLIPSTITDAFAKGEILQILVIAILFGAALSMIGERGRVVTNWIDSVSGVLFRVVHIITKVAPLGAFGAMAFTIGKYGIASLVPLAKLMGTFYLTSFLFVIVVLGLIAKFTGFSIFRFLAYIKEELLIVLGTSSSEAALPQLMEKMENAGCSKSVVGLVIPTGYSGPAAHAARRGDADLEGRVGRDRRRLHHAGCHARRDPDDSGGRDGADPRYRPLHERVPCADEPRRQRRGDHRRVGLGKGTGPQAARAGHVQEPRT